MNNEKSKYDLQAESFLEKNNVKFRATLTDGKTPLWYDGKPHGHHFRVTLSKAKPFQWKSARITFDFWSSIADREKGIKTVSAYSVLACLASDSYCADTFKDFCADYGYEEDSRKAEKTFKACRKMAHKLREFFTSKELEQLQEIQ